MSFSPIKMVAAASGFFQAALDEMAPHESAMLWRDAVEAGWRPDEPGMYCPRCGANTRPTAVVDEKGCRVCLDRRFPWKTLVRVGAYSQPVEEWIRIMKFRRAWTWGERLGELIADAVRTHAVGKRAAFCPVPMHWRRRFGRGFNQAELLARTAGKRLNMPIADVLYRARYTAPQSGVPDSLRRSNASKSFGVRRVDLSGWEIWLVDDVKTSGATLSRCARLLRARGADRVHVAVVAVAQSRASRFDAPIRGSQTSDREEE